jgi:hypothetical protein
MTTKQWVYYRKDTNNRIETNDLAFLLHRLRTAKGLEITDAHMADIILRGRLEGKVRCDGAEMVDIVIEEKEISVSNQ